MSAWTTGPSDLRTALSDNVADKLRYRKTVFGTVDGVNTSFKTLEFRRLTDLTAPTGKLGFYVNGVLKPVSTDFPDTGDFEAAVAPQNGDRVEASYYIQWFNDAEILQFLRVATNWLNLGEDYNVVPSGLHPSALDYAKAEAYDKLALRWSERLSETYLLEDAVNKDRFAIVDTYKKWGADLKKQAAVSRNDFYSRSGQNEAPASGAIFGGVREVVPER